MTTPTPDLSQLRIRRDAPSAGARRGAGGVALWILLGALVVAAGWWAMLRPRALQVQVAVAAASGGGSASGEGISANGYVVARTKASVSAKIPGRMEYLGVREGSEVKRGEIIARLESGDYQAALNAARATVAETEAQLVQARRDVDRARRLRQDQVISDVEVENVTTRLKVLEAQLGAARAQRELAAANLENTRVRAPFDGTVLRKDAEVGEIVSPSSAGGGFTRTAIVTMADLGTLEVEVDVNEAYIAQIHNEQPARIILDAYPDTSFTGTVRQVVPTADRQKATVLVKVSILDRDPRILPEMGAKVIFLRDPKAQPVAAAPRRVTVPSAAVVQGPAGARVWVVEARKVAARPVQVGREQGENVEITSGLSGGESVVLRPPSGLKDGAQVRVVGS
ncbi:MAG: efflux RND transporter periplasmic adaptor subunit [Candidatus Eisenbacteria bacterium]|uniref:Efflux RND transporter periplasmic adaptor subunit n=1 Tax=Eiseniibacteriota bacterium TaxID=2212470 RepID=A0A538SBF1_UNCEI|nr:MAG: efflux RND transporter periplasmic adaptor subunit [Candidatus Eisenbacteria bacterium]